MVSNISRPFFITLSPEKVKIQLKNVQNSRFLKIPSKIDPFGCLQLVIGMHRSHKMAPSEGFITFWCLRGYSILVSCQIQPQEWFILSWIPHRNCKIVCYFPISKYKSHQYFVNQTSNWQLKRLTFSGLFYLLSKADFKGIRLGFDLS